MERQAIPNLKRVCKEVLRSLSFSQILSFLEVKEVMFLQLIDRFAYKIGIPRALFISPIILKQPCTYHSNTNSILIYNTENGKT